MKKQLLFLNLFLFFTLFSFAQISITDKDGTPINDGDLITTNTIENSGKLVFYVDNNTDAPVNLKVTIADIVGSDGSHLQFCYGTTCYFSVENGAQYPAAGDADVIIDANGQLHSAGNYFWNNSDTEGDATIEYTIKFEDANSDFELTMTYKYDKNHVNVSEFNQIPVEIFPTVAKENITINVKENVAGSIFDLSGRLVKKTQLTTGSQTVNVSDLSAQTYILKLENNKGQITTRKFIIK
ncbi:T9SS type A sorting domain-containing protein [Aureivirga sp. CE67]|uniref:T9SS type A sorting domain-containing protein n=1 Tax=Aureivirga sp. CE67 TaxID=1788983 RepID=UPI0018C9AB00|nr:T9SS type A sorting domain-containing protein [Aureivirga sp. CE67]